MRHSDMGKFGTVFVSFVVLCASISISECKRSACWRYGHSCWGGHGKRSGVGLSGESIPGIHNKVGLLANTGVGSGTSPPGESQMFGMMDKTTGRFVPFPVLSMMMMLRNRESHPPVRFERPANTMIPTYPLQNQQKGQRSIGFGQKMKRGDQAILLNPAPAQEVTSGGVTYDNLAQQRENTEDEENASGITSFSLDQSISKEDVPNRSEKTGEYDSLSGDEFTKEVSLTSSSEERQQQPLQSNSLFVRARKSSSSSGDNSQSSEQVNSANEEDSLEGSSLRRPHAPRFLLNKFLHGLKTM